MLFEWSQATQGLILGSFYYGYVLTHIPGGMLAERFGGKWVLGFGLLSTAICTFITPITVKMGGATALFILRVIEGFGEVSEIIILFDVYYGVFCPFILIQMYPLEGEARISSIFSKMLILGNAFYVPM